MMDSKRFLFSAIQNFDTSLSTFLFLKQGWVKLLEFISGCLWLNYKKIGYQNDVHPSIHYSVRYHYHKSSPLCPPQLWTLMHLNASRFTIKLVHCSVAAYWTMHMQLSNGDRKYANIDGAHVIALTNRKTRVWKFSWYMYNGQKYWFENWDNSFGLCVRDHHTEHDEHRHWSAAV